MKLTALTRWISCLSLLALALVTWPLHPASADERELPVIPAAKTCELQAGSMTLSGTSRIVVSQPELLPVASVVASEIKQLVGIELSVVHEPARAGDILLELDAGLHDEAYAIEITDTAKVRAGNALAVAQATTTLLQALRKTDAGAEIPHATIQDAPAAEYRGLMIDCARYGHSPETLKQLITLCHWYKVRYLHLHLTDDQGFTFPSTSLPELVTKDRHFTLEQLRDLETFAKDRGVVLIPELDVPGHATALVQALPKLFGTNPAPVGDCSVAPFQAICAGREEVYQALDKLVGEMSDVFRTSPYFHIGADEINYRYWEPCSDTKAYMAAHQIESMDELYRHFLVRMNEIVKRHGKTTIVWEGFAKEGKIQIPRDVIVEVFECQYNLPPDLLASGYRIINTAWQPLYVCAGDPKRMWPPEYIYGWNQYRWESCWKTSKAFENPIVVAPTPNVLGAQLCAWEQPQEIELPTLRQRLAAMSERIWNPDAGRTPADFAHRLKNTDAALEKLLH